MVILFIKRIIVNVFTLSLFFSFISKCHMLSQDKPKNEKELLQS